MSRIEEAIRQLRGQSAPAPATPGANAVPRQVVRRAERKKIEISGPKHHVSQENLLRGGLLAAIDHANSIADEFRRIKRPLIANAAKQPLESTGYPNVIMLASALPGAGKTFCAVNLAFSMSLERELNVLLVDGDVAKPHISREFGLEEQPGLIDLVLDERMDVSAALVRTDINDILVLPAGHRHPQATELLASERMASIMRELAIRYPDRIVILDSPPLLLTSEAQALAGQVGQIALIVEAGRTSHDVLKQTIQILDLSKAVNLILNKSRNWGRNGYYGGDYAYYRSQGA